MVMKQFTYWDVHTGKKVCIAFSTIEAKIQAGRKTAPILETLSRTSTLLCKNM